MAHKKLYRSRQNRFLAGVCGGIGEYFDLDPVWVRIGFVLLALGHGFGVLLYLILIFVVPKEPGRNSEEAKINFAKSAQEMKEMAQDFSEHAKSAVEEFKHSKGWLAEKRNLIGLILIIIGFIALVNILFPMQMYWFRWNYLWPLAIIIIGVYLIIKQK